MKTLGKLGGLALALAAAGSAQAQTKACISEAQMGALVSYALPSVLEGARKSCSAVLGANSFLAGRGEALVGRYRSEGAGRWPAARDAFLTVMKDQAKLVDVLGDDGAKALLDGVFTGLVAEEVKPKDCARIDEAVGLLAPLPAENLARLVTLIFVAVDKGGASKMSKASPFRICPAGSAR